MTLTLSQASHTPPRRQPSSTNNWAPLTMAMRRSDRVVVLLRPGGFWGGPEQPRQLLDCLAQLHLHTRVLIPAPVATFPDAGTAWSAWERWYITDSTSRTRQRGWTVDYLPLASIHDWTRIPPIRPGFILTAHDRAALSADAGGGQ